MTERVFDSIATSLTWIERNWGTYHERRLDYRRGNLPTNSLPEHVAGSGEPSMPELDALEVSVGDGWKKIRAHLDTARIALRGVESEMAFLVNATKRPEDPQTQACGNVTCPDAKIFDMIGNDRPHDSDGRCAACHMAWKRSGYTRERSIKWQSTEDVEVVA